jgi:hypothetical protein
MVGPVDRAAADPRSVDRTVLSLLGELNQTARDRHALLEAVNDLPHRRGSAGHRRAHAPRRR